MAAMLCWPRPPDANLKTLAAAIKARWVCEQAHQQLKEERRIQAVVATP